MGGTICRKLLGLLAEEFAAQAFILIIAHHEHLLDPLDRIPVQLLVLLLAIFAPSAHTCRGFYSSIEWLTVGAVNMIRLAGRVDDFRDCGGSLAHESLLINLHGVPVQFPLQLSSFTNALFMVVGSRLARMGL